LQRGRDVESSNRRADYRVAVPDSLVRKLAVWFCPQKEYKRLGAVELGRPHLTMSTLGSGRMILTDLSIRGLGMYAVLSQDIADQFLSAKTCFTYLQLWDPTADDPFGVLSVFTYNNLARVAEKDEGLIIGARFVRFAVGSRLEKALDFLDAQVCGVSALARWCDNIARGVQLEPGRHYCGLDMDNLLAEIETVTGATSEQGGEVQ